MPRKPVKPQCKVLSFRPTQKTAEILIRQGILNKNGTTRKNGSIAFGAAMNKLVQDNYNCSLTRKQLIVIEYNEKHAELLRVEEELVILASRIKRLQEEETKKSEGDVVGEIERLKGM